MPAVLVFFEVLEGANFRVVSIDANLGFKQTDRIRTSDYGVFSLRLRSVPFLTR